MKVQPAQNLVRNAIDTCRFGFNDKETLVYNLQPGFGPKSQSSVYRHPFSAFAGDEGDPLLLHVNHRCQRSGKGLAVQLVIAFIDEVLTVSVHPGLVKINLQPLLHRDRSSILQFDLKIGKSCIQIGANTDFAAFFGGPYGGRNKS
jgi:hypothetical protein